MIRCFRFSNWSPILIICLIIFGCATRTYKSEYQASPNLSIHQYKFILVDPENPKVPGFNVNSLIEGIFFKHGFTAINSPKSLSNHDLQQTLVASWRETGRNTRALGLGYSVEITVLVTDYLTKQVVYQGVGESMGKTVADDVSGAIIAAFKNLTDAQSGLTGTYSDKRRQPIKPELMPAIPNIHKADGWAVIIGVSIYQHKDNLDNLVFADDDAKAFRRALINLGWSDSHIKLLANEEATKRNITIALESWLTKAGPNDQIVLFWAGHGYSDPEDPEKVYLACYDTDIKIPATGYRMGRVRFVLEERKAKNVIVFADTCHAGKLITRGDRGISIIPNIEKLRREKKVPKGWIFMVGADTDRQAIEHSSWSNGAFTHSLIKGLSGEADGFQSAGIKDGAVTMGELKDFMNTEMPYETQRVIGVAKRPVITTSSGDPDIWNLTLQPK